MKLWSNNPIKTLAVEKEITGLKALRKSKDWLLME